MSCPTRGNLQNAQCPEATPQSPWKLRIPSCPCCCGPSVTWAVSAVKSDPYISRVPAGNICSFHCSSSILRAEVSNLGTQKGRDRLHAIHSKLSFLMLFWKSLSTPAKTPHSKRFVYWIRPGTCESHLEPTLGPQLHWAR